MAQHSIIEHKANYFYVRLEDDYLALCEKVNREIEALNLPDRESSGPADCKSMMLSVLEHWMNSKRLTAKCEEDLYVYLTYEEWEHQLRYRYKRSVIIRCLKEMPREGQWQDAEGEIQTGLIKVRHYVQNTYAYLLNVPVIQGLVTALPEQSPYGPRPKIALGRPRKNHSKINGLKTNDINLNRLKTDDISEIPSENTRFNEEIPSKNKRSFYTQISNNTDLSKTQISESSPDADASPSRASQSDINFIASEKKEVTVGEDSGHHSHDHRVLHRDGHLTGLHSDTTRHDVSPKSSVPQVDEASTGPDTQQGTRSHSGITLPAYSQQSPPQEKNGRTDDTVVGHHDSDPPGDDRVCDHPLLVGNLDVPTDRQVGGPHKRAEAHQPQNTTAVTPVAKGGVIEPTPSLSVAKPDQPLAEMAWGTRKCLLMFDEWRGAPLIGKYKLGQASECAKGLAANYSEEQVRQARDAMEIDPYYIGRGGADVCDVANNISKYLKKLERKRPVSPPSAEDMTVARERARLNNLAAMEKLQAMKAKKLAATRGA